MQQLRHTDRKNHDYRTYHRTNMQKEKIIQHLKEQGCRITRQRLILLEIILDEECSCCKEIYYKAIKVDARIGKATVYRMINTLEEIGAISRKNMYRIICGEYCDAENECRIEMEDDTTYHFTPQKLNAVIEAGLEACGYPRHKKIRNVVVSQNELEEEEPSF